MPSRLGLIIVGGLLFVACGQEYGVRNDYKFEQQAACSILLNNDDNCADYLAELQVQIVDRATIQKVCVNPLASGCARYSRATVYVWDETNVGYCAIIVHEFMHFLGRHYYDDGDGDHDRFEFDKAYDVCDNRDKRVI